MQIRNHSVKTKQPWLSHSNQTSCRTTPSDALKHGEKLLHLHYEGKKIFYEVVYLQRVQDITGKHAQNQRQHYAGKHHSDIAWVSNSISPKEANYTANHFINYISNDIPPFPKQHTRLVLIYGYFQALDLDVLPTFMPHKSSHSFSHSIQSRMYHKYHGLQLYSPSILF